MSEIYVRGYAQLDVPAEWVRLRISILAEGATGAEALDRAAPISAEVDQVLSEYAASITKTASTSLGVHRNLAQLEEQKYWLAAKSLYAETGDLARLPGLVIAITDAGATAQASEWGIDPKSPLYSQTRMSAVADALEKASDYASALGREIGEVLSICETGVAGPRNRHYGPRAFAVRSSGDPQVSFDPANVVVAAEVEIAFTLA